MSALIHALTTPTIVLATARGLKHVSRSVLLYRAGSTALKRGSEDQRGKAGLEVVDALTRRDEAWYATLIKGWASRDRRP